MFTEHIGNLHSATSLDQLKQVLEQILGDCESALTHNGTLDINEALKAGATGAVVNISNGYIAPNDATTAPDANGELPNGWAQIINGGAWFKGQVKFDQAPVGDGGFGLPAGAVVLWAGAIGSIPTGWALMDGTANSVGNGGSGIDMRGMIPYGYSGSGDFATIGGSIAVALATSFSGSGTANTSTDPGHNHEITGTEISGAISISAHADNDSTFATESNGASLTPGLFDAGLMAGSDYDAWIWLQADGTPAVAGHTHNVDQDNISAALTNHTVSTTATNAETEDGGSHLHTVTISDIASGLTVGTPTTVRTPGKVVAFIEKLAA